jgi:hypothetical protein
MFGNVKDRPLTNIFWLFNIIRQMSISIDIYIFCNFWIVCVLINEIRGCHGNMKYFLYLTFESEIPG